MLKFIPIYNIYYIVYLVTRFMTTDERDACLANTAEVRHELNDRLVGLALARCGCHLVRS